MTGAHEIPSLIGIGDLAADIVIRFDSLPVQKDDFSLADSFDLEAGGTASFLIAAARLGAPASAVGSIGDDVWGHEIGRILESEQVDMSLLTPSGSTTRALVLVDHAGDHAFVGKFGAGKVQDLDDRSRSSIRQAGAVFASGYSLSEQHLAALTLQSLAAAGESSVVRAFDPGPAYARLPNDLKNKVLALTDLLFLTSDELPIVSTNGISSLLDLGIRAVVLKLGSRGCEVHTADGMTAVHPGFQVPVVDTTAAGDSFAAGFLRAYTAGLPLDECALLANAVGAVKVQKLGGGRNVATAQEIRELLANAGQPCPLNLP